MFGKEKHSREGYDEIENQIPEALAAANEHPGHGVPTGETRKEKHYGGGYSIRSVEKYIPSPQQGRLWKLIEKLERMKEAGHGEALGLEAKHNKLIKDVEDAHAELEAFEKEQLGMDRA